jgi:hypothetical protein
MVSTLKEKKAMNKLITKLNEATDLNLFKRILGAFSCFVGSQPGTGMNRVYRSMLDINTKMMPKDQRALDILSYITKDKSDSAIVQDIMNKSLNDLPCTIRPVYKAGSAKFVAFWSVDGKIYSKAVDLLDLDGKGSSKYWSDEKGNKVDLIDVSTEEV